MKLLTENSEITPINIEESLSKSYLDYSMSVIVGRAIPDVRDGLKPVHRRILYAMNELHITHRTPYKKSARIVGDVIGKFHPHGDSAVYEALVRMAQDFSMREELVDGQGNFGSIDGDSAAAQRYCAVGSTKIRTDKGLINLSDLVPNTTANSDSEFSGKVLSFENKIHSASKFFNSGKHEIFEVKTKKGFKIQGTKNHPILTFGLDSESKPKYIWKRLDEINGTEKIVIDRSEINLNSRTSSASESEKNLAIIYGCLISEGSISENRITFNNTDKKYFDDFISAWKSEFGESFYNYQRTLKSGKTIYEFDIQLQHSKDSEKIKNSQLFTDLVSKKAREKNIPSTVFSFPKDGQQLFLKYLFEGDGSVSLVSKNTISLQYSTFSQQLAEDVQIMLLQFGVIGHIQTFSNSEEKKIVISNFRNIEKFAQNVGFATQKEEKLQEILKSEYERKGDKLGSLSRDFIPFISAYMRSVSDSFYLKRNNFDRYERIDANFEKITQELELAKMQKEFVDFYMNNYFYDEIEAFGKTDRVETVYSIKVDSDCHSFVGNGFVNHNTEVRMTKYAEDLLADLDKETVNFNPNYDDSLFEPEVLPTRVPNLLINGSSGIAVGMATSIPPHNPVEIIQASIETLKNPEISFDELFEIVQGPDFPTGGYIFGKSGIISAYQTGRGRVKVRAKVHQESKKNSDVIVIDELPYQANKSRLIEQIANLVKDKSIEGISTIRDESDRKGIRVVIELKRDAMYDIVLNNLYKATSLSTTFSMIFLAVKNQQPKVFALKEILEEFISHRKSVVIRRTLFELNKAKSKAHILDGIIVSLQNIDEVIKLIKSSENNSDAKNILSSKFNLSVEQTQAILEMRLNKLTSLETNKIKAELEDLNKLITELNEIINNQEKLKAVILEELEEVKSSYNSPRLTEIQESYENIEEEDLIPNLPMVVTVSHRGYVKRVPLSTYEKQNRGGKGKTGVTTYDDDFIESFFTSNTHDTLLITTNLGQLYWLKVYKIPEGSRTAKGKAIVNLISLKENEKVKSIIPTEDFNESKSLVFFTKKGIIKRTQLSEFKNIRTSGVRAIKLDDDDELILSQIATEQNQTIMIFTHFAQAIKFKIEDVREMGRNARGVIGIKFKKENDFVVDATIFENDSEEIVTISSNGIGKRTTIGEYRLTKRGGTGVIGMKLTEKTGFELKGIAKFNENSDLMLLTSSGKMIRVDMNVVSKIGRNASGVTIVKGDTVSSVTSCPKKETPSDDQSNESNNSNLELIN